MCRNEIKHYHWQLRVFVIIAMYPAIHSNDMPGVALMVRVVSLGSQDPEFKSHSAIELKPGGVDSACHPSEVGKMGASLLVSCVGVATHPVLCPIAKETDLVAPTLCTEYGPHERMESTVIHLRLWKHRLR